MTQQEILCLLMEVVDNVNWISYYQHYLKIALEQFERPNDSTTDRVDLLISTFLQQAEWHFDEIDAICKKIKESNDEKSSID